VFYHSKMINPDTVPSHTSASNIQVGESEKRKDLPNELRLFKQNTFGVGGTLPCNLRRVPELTVLQHLNCCT